MFSLAIDFGSVNTAIYRKGEGLVLKEPSLVCAKQVGDKYEIIALGSEAKKLQGKTDDKTYIFSPVVEGKIKAKEYAVELLKYFLKKVRKVPFLAENAIVCIKSTLNNAEKQDIVDVFKLAGLKKVVLVPEIICDANMCVQDISSSKTSFVLDVSGTTSEIALINTFSIIKGGCLNLGGRNLDIEIANFIASKYNVTISIATAQKLKEEISSLYENDSQMYEIVGFDEEQKKPNRVIISSEELFPIMENFANKLVLLVETSINVCPPEILGDILSNGLYLCGGSSCISGISKYLRKKLGIDVKLIENNENSSILGAGKFLLNQKDLLSVIRNFN